MAIHGGEFQQARIEICKPTLFEAGPERQFVFQRDAVLGNLGHGFRLDAVELGERRPIAMDHGRFPFFKRRKRFLGHSRSG